MRHGLLIVVTVLWTASAYAQSNPEKLDAPAGTTPAPAAPATQDTPTAPAAAAVPLVAPIAAPQPAPAVSSPMRDPLAGYANGSFFLRDHNDWFVLFPKGRLQIDGFAFLNRGDAPTGVEPGGPKDPRPKDTIFVRRAHIELQGTFARHFDFHLAGEYASTPATGATGIVADAYVIVDYLPYLKLQGGQFDIPFSIENRVSDKFIDFMERSIPVRAFAVPTNKDQGAMLLGWLPRKTAYYSLGVFNGDGQNYKNQDNGAAVIGRAFIAPFAWMAHDRRWLEEIWVGGSFWWQRNSNVGGPVTPNVTGGSQDDLTSMTTQGGFGFFSTSYGNGTDGSGNAVRSHLAPSGDTVKWALEANVPLWSRLGARFELVHQSVGLAQYNDTNTANATLLRTRTTTDGKLDGYGYYIEVYGWILGNMNIIEPPGQEPMPRIKKFSDVKEVKWGLQVLAKYEHLGFGVSGLPGGAPDTMGNLTKDPAEGNYSVHVFELGLNAWATKHVRLTANYVMNYIDGDSAQVKKNFFYQRAEHELLCRVGINL